MIRVTKDRRTTITLMVKEDSMSEPVLVKQITADTNNQGVSNIGNFVINQDLYTKHRKEMRQDEQKALDMIHEIEDAILEETEQDVAAGITIQEVN